ncbi:MAG: hypothetical protein MI974_16565 [Chitinophagales bacterium]|nr:hypothetical protein [Chitinophagales bacterium]
MKSLLFVAMLLCGSAGFGMLSNDHTPKYENSENNADYIVMEDAILMLVSTDSSNGNIDSVEIRTTSGTLVLTLSGCSSNACRYDLSSLSSANYDVDVSTTTSYTFSGSISL